MDKPERHAILFKAIILSVIMVVSAPATTVPATLSKDYYPGHDSPQLEILKPESYIFFFPNQSMESIKDQSLFLGFLNFTEGLVGGSIVSTQKNMAAGPTVVKTIGETETEKNTQNDFTSENMIKKEGSGIEAEVSLNIGYRRDDLDFNISGPTLLGNHVNILSELTWDNIEIYQLKLRSKAILRKVFYLRGSLGYGMVFNGDSQDSDYLGNNRTFEYSRSNSSTDDDQVWDASLGIGYQFSFGRNDLGVTPLIGYSYHQQNLTIRDGNQTISSKYTPPVGPIPGLDSTYDAEWNGPWVGLDINYKFSDKHAIFAEVEYHWPDYYAELNWNLRSDLAHPKSFDQKADGSGIVVSTGWIVSFNRHWALNINLDYQDWSADCGTERVFFSDGAIVETPLNEVNWKSFGIMMGAAYHF